MAVSERELAFQYGDERIVFVLNRVASARPRIGIHVLPEGSVRVDAPEDAALADVLAAVQKRARWIWIRLQARHELGLHVLPREYVSGESHFYLGRRHMLKIFPRSDAPAGVKLLRGKLEITSASNDPKRIRSLLEAWYRRRAQEVFARRLTELTAAAPWLGQVPPFRLQVMRTQWGSCSPARELLLNPHLVKAPRPCIDYVLAHELCHLKQHNHSPAFYRLLSALLPDWPARKEELDGMAEALLN